MEYMPGEIMKPEYDIRGGQRGKYATVYPRRIVVGIAGRMRAGKDTVAQRLVERWGFTRVGIADALKDEVRTRFRRTLLAYASEVEGVSSDDEPGQDRIIAWLLNAKPPVIRALLQEYGSEVRRADDPEYWCRKWFNHVFHSGMTRVVVPDVRFPNEVSYIAMVSTAAYLVKVTRPGTPESDHPSEVELDCPLNAHFRNDGSIEELWEAVDRWIAPLVGESGSTPPSDSTPTASSPMP